MNLANLLHAAMAKKTSWIGITQNKKLCHDSPRNSEKIILKANS